MNLNVHEARLGVTRIVAEVLVDLADDGEISEEDLDDLEVAMLDAASIVLESLAFEVQAVQPDGTVVVHLRLPEDEPE